jgi:FtsP/CotA-like multicopper oxidase with cupredoxin domain
LVKSRKYLLIGIAGIVLLIGSCALAAVLFLSDKMTFVNEHLGLENRLFIPPQLAPRLENGEKVFALTLQQGETTFFPGERTKTAGFNGSYLGPTLRASTGDHVRINITNSLSETATVHWHGMHLPAAMDGGPHQVIEPGAIWQPDWTITNEAATLWYHPHQMGKTGAQVYEGLAGLFIIDDANADALNLPQEYGVDDIPLIVQDRQFDAAGQFIYHPPGPPQSQPPAAGMLGDTILVNGTRAPYVEVPQKLIRLRVVNGSDGRRYNFGFADNRAFYQIATDGGLLESPVERIRMLLAPGERAEILVDLSAVTGPLTLMSYPIVDGGNVFIKLAKKAFGDNDENQQFKVLEIRPRAGTFAAQAIPQRLNTIHRLSEAAVVQTRRFALDTDTINSKAMDDTRVDAVVKKGDIEIWEIRNESPFYHPFHIHGVQFLVLGRNGAAPPAYEQGWKDTIIVNPAETVRLIMQFNDYADPTLPYMFHCHILEHEDMGMMGQFVVVDNLTDAIHLQSPLMDMPTAQPAHP